MSSSSSVVRIRRTSDLGVHGRRSWLSPEGQTRAFGPRREITDEDGKMRWKKGKEEKEGVCKDTLPNRSANIASSAAKDFFSMVPFVVRRGNCHEQVGLPVWVLVFCSQHGVVRQTANGNVSNSNLTLSSPGPQR